MIVQINSSTVTITGNPTLERNVKEELDTGLIVIQSTRAKRYEMYDKVDITTPFEDVEQYLVQADSIVQLNATTYEHTLTLFENIAFFNTVYPADRSFKVQGQTLEDILTVYKRELSAYHNIEITWANIPQSVLDEVIPFKEFSGLNFSTILLSLFRKIWAVPKVTRVNAVWDIYPLYHNERNNSIATGSISKISAQNNVDYATKVKSQLKNAVNERVVGELTWFPSESGYILPKPSSIENITSNLRYELDSNIISIAQAIVVDVPVELERISDNVAVTDTISTVDITRYIVQNDIWDLLKVVSVPSETSDNIFNHIRYKVGDRYINNLYDSAGINIVLSIAVKYLLNALTRELYLNTNDYWDDTVYTFLGLNTAGGNYETEDVKMRFKYIRQRNIDLVHNRKTKGDMNETTTIHQQRDSSVELNEYKKNLKIYSNRMGNNENSKTKVFKYPLEPYELFDYTDNKTIVTRVQNTWHNKFVYCEYEESESFSNIEAEYALMRRSDPYSITAKAVTTNIIAQEYIEFSETERDANTRLTPNAQRVILGLFEATTIPYDKVAVGVFKPVVTGWNDDYAIHMPVEASGDANLITVHVQFPNQTIAGKTYYDLDADTLQTYLNPLPYVDTDGTLANYQLYFTPDVLFEDTGEYPLILDETDYLAEQYTYANVTEPIDLDVAASFAKTFQVSFIADENIFIGNAMASSNYFVKDQATTTAIKVYTSTKPYGQYDQAPRTYDTDNTASISYTYSFTNRTITITPSIAVSYFSIVKDDEILLAVNRDISAGGTLVIHINRIVNDNNITISASVDFGVAITLAAALDYTFRIYPISLSVDSLSAFSTTASLGYSFRIYPMSLSVTSLSSLSATAGLAYSFRIYPIGAVMTGLSAITATANVGYSLRQVYTSASVTGLSSLTTTASVVYTDSYTGLYTNATGLSSIVGTGSIAYTSRIYPTSATATNLATVTSSTSLGYSIRNVVVSGNATGLANVTGSVALAYTERAYVLQPNAPSVSNLSGTASISYTFIDQALRATPTNLANLRATVDISVPPSLVEWVQVSSGTPSGTTCIYESDLGNIKTETVPSCRFVKDGSAYQPGSDLTSEIPTCEDDATYTICFLLGSIWICQDYRGVEGTTTTYYECQYK